MSGWVALLRAVNVGGNKVLMEDLRALAEREGFAGARTYIASGNLVFESALEETEIRQRLEAALEKQYGKPIGVIVRAAEAMAKAVADNPFARQPGNKVAVLFTDEPVSVEGVRRADLGEELVVGERVIYIHYASGMGQSKLVIPAAKAGTMRNMNTVAKLSAMAEAKG